MENHKKMGNCNINRKSQQKNKLISKTHVM